MNLRGFSNRPPRPPRTKLSPPDFTQMPSVSGGEEYALPLIGAQVMADPAQPEDHGPQLRCGDDWVCVLSGASRQPSLVA